ncbi:metallophosphoesterase [Verrucosispora sp. TAA-831]|uniref:metallophosphoesterase n=1 Tax=Verrucosispora sp. TAA-831 TaxID=3422227 RepID=UPI003D6F9CCC
MPGSLFAVSDLPVAYAENREITDRLAPESDDDWLIVAGDVGAIDADAECTLRRLRGRFREALWSPGNHELRTHPRDPVRLRGVDRYRALVDVCPDHGIHTPEDDDGHLRLPRTIHHDGVRFEQVSLGCPREWRRRGTGADPLRRILAGRP